MTRYSPYTWADDEGGATPITAARLNALEAGADADVPVADIDATGTPSGTTFLRGDGAWATPAGGGGALDDLTDVDAAAPADGDVLTFDTGTGDWVAAAPTGGGGAVDSVNGATGTVVLDQDDVGDGTTYKQYSATEKTKLAGIATAATANDTDANLKARANHTGTQTASTISDFATTVRATTASDTAAGSVELATDAEAVTGTDTARAVTPANVGAVVAVTRARYSAVNAQTGTTYTPVLSDEGKLVTLSNASAITVTMPQDSATAFPVGATIDFVGIGAGLATFSAGTGATVNPTAATRAQWSAVTAIKRAANTWLIVGDLA